VNARPHGRQPADGNPVEVAVLGVALVRRVVARHGHRRNQALVGHGELRQVHVVVQIGHPVPQRHGQIRSANG